MMARTRNSPKKRKHAEKDENTSDEPDHKKVRILPIIQPQQQQPHQQQQQNTNSKNIVNNESEYNENRERRISRHNNQTHFDRVGIYQPPPLPFSDTLDNQQFLQILEALKTFSWNKIRVI